MSESKDHASRIKVLFVYIERSGETPSIKQYRISFVLVARLKKPIEFSRKLRERRRSLRYKKPVPRALGSIKSLHDVIINFISVIIGIS